MIESARRNLGRSLAVACAALALVASGRDIHAQQSGAPQRAPKPAGPAVAIPSAEQILNHYEEAEGGRAVWMKLTSRVSTGMVEIPAMSLSGTVEVREKAPDLTVGVVTINGASFRQGFDGKVGWTDDPQNGLREQTGAELAETRREADFYHPLDMRKIYTKFAVTGKEKIGEREAYVMEATLPEGGDPDKIYFDTQIGLSLRLISHRHLPEGVSEFREDFEDYREVDGIQLPFIIHQTDGSTAFTITISEIHHNVAIDDSLFAKPAAQ